ncbi:hypothetical protein SLEP1_g55098 [Rubroshorea leprosula]|uniref:Reverse transcriptase domain-containing protein n=1 Tax=Rubroshorea leprosula TaxID=152421 RepID=A0AAV5MEE1_9ROSI|nr:hypothetical protein SLEP1_g55098 [Rubroshorea leprosula]
MYREDNMKSKAREQGKWRWRPKQKNPAWPEMELKVNQEESEWLEKCFVGIVHSATMIPTLQEKFFMEGVFFCKIRVMGGRMVLLERYDYEDLKELIETGRDWPGRWFLEIKPWSLTTVAVERFVWIKCLGLPLHAWKSEYFQSFGNLWGTFVSLDDSTSRKKRLDVARFLITIPMMESISKSLDIKVNGVMYHIKFFEEEHNNGFYIMDSDFKIKGDNHIDEEHTEESSGDEEHSSIGSEFKHTEEGAEAEIESVDLWVLETVMEEGEKKLDEVACIPDNTSAQKSVNTQNGQQKQKTRTAEEFKYANNVQEEEMTKRKEAEGIATNRFVRTPNKHLMLEGLEEDVRQQNTKMGVCSNGMETGNNSKGGSSAEGSWESSANNIMGLTWKAGRRNGPNGSGNTTKPKERSNGLEEDVRQQNTKMGICSNGMETGNNSKGGSSKEGSWESSANNIMGLTWKAGRRNGPTGSGNTTKPTERSNGLKDNGNSSNPLALQRPNEMKKRRQHAALEDTGFTWEISEIYMQSGGLQGFQLQRKKKGKKLVTEKMTQQVGFEADPGQAVANDSINDSNIQNCNRGIIVKDNIKDTEALWNRIKDLGISTIGDEIPMLHKLEEMEMRDKEEKKRTNQALPTRNEINEISVGGKVLKQVEEIKKGIMKYYASLFTDEGWKRPTLEGLNFKSISEANRCMLTQPFTEDEVKLVVWSCDSSKAPGLDGFSFGLLKNEWEVIKVDVMKFLTDFHKNGRLVRGSNASFLVLIPKTENPQGIKEYRPISLIGCPYKILAKLLANRLSKVLSTIIGETQSAFIKGRQLLNGVMVTNEAIEGMRKKKSKGFIFKIDFEKAYDNVSWSFLDYMMERMGFNKVWRGWISECLKSSIVSVLINGSATKEFAMSRGRRQGDPLAPFLFLITAKAINGLTSTAIAKGFLQGVIVEDGELRISHLQFADDTLFMGEATKNNIWTVKCIMRAFELVSSLKDRFSSLQISGSAIRGKPEENRHLETPNREVQKKTLIMETSIPIFWRKNHPHKHCAIKSTSVSDVIPPTP